LFLRSNDLAGHAGLGSVDKAITAQSIDLDGHLVSDEVASFPGSHSVSCNNGGGVDLVLDQLVGPLQELSGNNDDRGGAITDLLILLLSQLDQNASSWMLHLQHVQNGGAVVGDGDILIKVATREKKGKKRG